MQRRVAAQHDIRPSWPLRQLAALVPHGRFEEVPGVAHSLWSTDPEMWVDLVTRLCATPGESAVVVPKS
ncbi:hypothetical protein AWN90_25350 [Nocardia terpenica]|uniref:Alpha/beta hydrolase n=1 Tax=Nocardia terpenica TaxID=455432 RepID=A0A164NIL7_9NOCA|nr:hypothetical protein AWN90_25350 [Nocardia terpenica]